MVNFPDEHGFFGDHGGVFVSDELKPVMAEIREEFLKCKDDPAFVEEYKDYLHNYVGRPTPFYFARRLTERLGGAKIYLKREDLNHTGSHKINNAIGQVLLARRLGKKRVIAETGAGQHGVATATACAMFNMECIVYMGEEDIRRQELNVFRMKLLGANVVSVTQGTKTLKDAIDVALADLAANYKDTYYMIGSAVGPDPYPQMVKFFQSVIGEETIEQSKVAEGVLPDYVLACVGGGSNAVGMFAPFYNEKTALIGIEPAGKGLETGMHAATLCAGTPGVLHGFKSYLLQDENGEPLPAYSVSAGLDYPGVGPEHSFYKDSGRAQYVTVTDGEALDAFCLLCEEEGIIPALESSHAVAYAVKLAPALDKDKILVINLSGRGDKDVHQVLEILNKK
ncbi:MAG: tryptophan synthase subunit beta [Clostridia bacterium]|nr:tryptophan synthase subunit beta [Clostridia bacterium]